MENFGYSRAWTDSRVSTGRADSTLNRSRCSRTNPVGAFVPRLSGHLAFVRNGVMLAMPFDVRTLQVSGTAVPLVDGIFESVSQGSAKLAVANTGTIAYVPAQAQQLAVAMVWVDRHGAVEPVPALHQTYETPRLSPDGQRVAVAVNNAVSTGDRDIWLYDISRATLSRFTTGTTAQAQAETPAWTPDGTHVTYATGPVRQFVWKAADGSGTGKPTLLFQGSFAATGSEASYDVSVDGQRFLMLKADDAATSESIVVIQDWMDEVKALVSRGK